MRRVRHDLFADQDAGLDELANLVMADTELGSRCAQRQPLAIFVGRAISVNATDAPERADTVSSPGFALAGRHAHAVQLGCAILVGPATGHAAHDGDGLLRCVAAMLT